MTLVEPQVADPELEEDDPILTHIVGPLYLDDGTKVTGGQRVLEAAVTGSPVTALCGYTWVPSRDPERHPLCQVCEAISQRTREDNS